MKEGWMAGGRTRLNLLCTYKPRAKRGRVYSRDRSALVRICESRCFAAQLLARRDDRGTRYGFPMKTLNRIVMLRQILLIRQVVVVKDVGRVHVWCLKRTEGMPTCSTFSSVAPTARRPMDGLDVLRFRHPPSGTASATRIFQE